GAGPPEHIGHAAGDRAPMRRAFSLVELVMALAIFSLVGMLAYLALSNGVRLWKGVTDSEGASVEMRKASVRLERDLALTELSSLVVAPGPNSLGPAPDGNAVCFLSPVDPATGQVARRKDGNPFWQRNILYYLVVPTNHQALFGSTCAGGVGPNGLDDRCPHKVLVRKVIDSGGATQPGAPESTAERPLTNLTPYLTRPNGYSLTAMGGEPGLSQVEIVGARLLTFRVEVAPEPTRTLQEVVVTLQGVALAEARKRLRVGQDPLSTGPFTRSLTLSVIPGN
ncbi:MAG: prepilin-type N-terminal cleavage/methylation domain-containing protein, partial [Candidatus Eremiobacterota bacterium]